MSESLPDAPADDGVLYKPRRVVSFESLVVLMNAIGSIFIVFIMAMICIDIVSRFAFAHPISGVTELTEIIIVGVVFLQLAHATRLGKLTRSDAALGILMVRKPRFAQGLSFIYDVSGAVLLGIIAWGTWPKLVTAWTKGYYVGNVGVFTFPEWPLWALVVIGSAIITIQFALLAIGHVRGAIANRSDAVTSGGH